MKPALPWQTAARIAWRELRAARGKFIFVLLSVAIGVAALTGVRGFSQAFQKALLGDARGMMAGDLSARMPRLATPLEDATLDTLATRGVERTDVTETISMASVLGDPVPLLVSLKAVDPEKYPFYGKVQLQPAGDLRDLLTDSTVLVDDNLLVRLNAHVGNQLKIGGHYFRIAAVILNEPDRMTAGVGLGPRVMITRHALMQTGLIGLGSRATERYLFKLTGKGDSIASLRAELEKTLPDAQVTDFRETNPGLTQGLDDATGLLSLICLVAMVLGAIGVAMSMRAHLQQRIEILAIMKSIGARSSDILRIYLLQTVLLGLAGGVLGVIAGLGVEYILPTLIGSLLPLRPPLALAWKPVSAALATGVLTTVLFCLPPLLDVRRVRPIAVLRKTVETAAGSVVERGWLQRLRSTFVERGLQWASMVVIVAGLAAVAAALTDSWPVGLRFAVLLAAALVALLLLSAGFLRLLREFLAKTRLGLPSAVRHGLANLYRPGNQSAAVLAALGAGVMLILAVYLMQSDIVRQMHSEVAPETPNLFLVDMAAQEIPGIKTLLAAQHGVDGPLETIPMLSSRILRIDGVDAEQLRLQLHSKRMLRSTSITWSDKQPAGTRIVEGAWWGNPEDSSLAVVDHAAMRLHLHIGSQVSFSVNEKTVTAKVTAIYKVVGEHAFARSEFILTPGLLRSMPATWYGAVHVAPAAIPGLERALFASYPTVTVINLADILQTIQQVAGHIILVIRFLAAFSILSGVMILASSVASTRFRRIREVVVLKTLGAARSRIAQVFSVEFLVLGLLAGTVGAIFANVLACVLLHTLKVPFHRNLASFAVTVVATGGMAVVTGWVASYRILGQKPLEVLREE